MVDYSLWEVIENGNAPLKTQVVKGVETTIAPTIAEEKEQRRLQKLISQLEIHGESISQEDMNQKFLRSLSPKWNTHSIVWSNKPEIDTLSLDNLYNNLKIYEPESDQAEDGLTNFALMAYSSTSSNSEINDKFKIGLGYNAVPPPYTKNFLPLKPDFSGLEEFVNEPIVKKPVSETSEAKASADKPKVVRKNFDPSLIEDWISNSEDEAELKSKIEKKTVKPSFAKIEFVKSKEQATVKAKTVNREGHLQALLDGKNVIITESTIRRDLQLEDAEGVDCLSNSVIFEQLTLMGFVQVFLNNQLEGMSNHNRIYVAPSHTKKIFRNMKMAGKGFSGRETPLFPTMMVQAQEEMGEGNQKRKVTEVPQPSDPTEHVADETVNKEMDNSLKRAVTTAPILDVKVLDFEATKTTQVLEIDSLKRRVKRLERRKRSRTQWLKRLYKVRLSARVESSEDEGLSEEDASKQERIVDIDANEDIYLVTIHNDEDIFGVNDLDGDEVIVEEEQEELTDAEKAKLFMQFLEKRRKFFAAKRAEEKKNIPPTRAQQRSIMTELVLESLKKTEAKVIEGSSKRAIEELEQERSKKQKVEDDKESEELKKCLEIIPDDVTIDAIPLAVKPPSIVDWRIQKEGKKSYYKIIRADGSSKIYLIFSHMLKYFDREDVETL
uniref:Uncharacterized protein n=1 Tax=Tanacetum cinerariifolium TaxID=118510 RepID=A0A6L2J6H7_TANCI|nr:hypothetical protein [Tanacetum cinerariifolium]